MRPGKSGDLMTTEVAAAASALWFGLVAAFGVRSKRLHQSTAFADLRDLRGLRGAPGSVEWLRWELVTSGLACRPRDESELHRDSVTDAHSG